MKTPAGDIKAMMVNGTSMSPFLQQGEMLVLGQVEFPLRPGRCYVFNYKNNLILHRLVFIDKNKRAYFVGDNSSKFETAEFDDISFMLLKDEPWIKTLVCRIVNRLSLSLGEYKAIMQVRRSVLRFSDLCMNYLNKTNCDLHQAIKN